MSGWTPVTEDTLKPKPAPAGWTPVVTPQGGFLSTLGSDLKGMASALLHPSDKTEHATTLKGIAEEGNTEMAVAAQRDAARKAAGYSPTYRALAPAAESLGMNVAGTEQAAAQGDTAAVLGHTAAPLATLAAGEAVAHGIPAIKEALPNTKRAGANFQDLEGAIGTHPVEVTDELSTSLNQLRKSVLTTNTNIPPVARKLMDRIDSFQGGGKLTYEEARAFSSELGDLAASDKMSMTANTQRLVNNVQQALKASVADTAELAGRGEQLSGAMSEYHHAMQIRNVSDAVKESLWKAILTGAGIYGVKKILDKAE